MGRADELISERSGSPRVLVIDIGGTTVKVLATGHRAPRYVRSGPQMTPDEMVAPG
jgi:hypothetical protein